MKPRAYTQIKQSRRVVVIEIPVRQRTTQAQQVLHEAMRTDPDKTPEFIAQCNDILQNMRSVVELQENIRPARVREGICQDYLAQKMGVSQSLISRIESGQTRATEDFVKRCMYHIKNAFTDV